MNASHRSAAVALLVLALGLPGRALAQDGHAAPGAHAAPTEAEGHGEGAHAFDPVHHSADGYYLDFNPIGSIELPRLFLVRRADGGLGFDAFGSTAAALRSGRYEAVAHQVDEEDLAAPEAVQHGEIEHAPASGTAATSSPEVEDLIASHAHLDAELAPESGALILDLSITRHLVFAILGAALVLGIFISLARRYKRGIGRTTAPRGLFQNLWETLIIFIRDEIAKPTLGDKYRRYLPYLLTVFFFILTCNLIGLVPFGGTATANIMVTAVLAICTFVVTQFSGSKDYWRHIFNPPGIPAFVKPILIPIEIMGMFTKPFALCIRLFANMTAGHLVILNLIGLIFAFTAIFGAGAGYGVSPVSVAFALFIYVLELLVAFIQAYVFTMLSALFIGMATAEHHHPEEGELPELHGPDHSHVTPHPIIGHGAEERAAARAAH
jgi:F-type H+-transporting ATPase subunit a